MTSRIALMLAFVCFAPAVAMASALFGFTVANVPAGDTWASTIGGVIAPGDPIMLIVPERDALIVEAQVSPADVDQIFSGQPAVMHFSAFDRNTTPEVNGRVDRISADLTNDQRTGYSYYVVRISFTPEEIARLKGLKLIPGMPVETFISTNSRTMLSYVLKPLADQLARSFREG